MRIKNELNKNIAARKAVFEENKTIKDLLKKWITKHRLNSRQNFGRVDVTTFIAFLPFALGLAQFFVSHSNSGKNESFFRENLPVFTTFTPKINFETFEYIIKHNASTPVDKQFLFRPFLAKIKPQVIENQNFNGLTCSSSTLFSETVLSKTSSNEKFFRNLDELPVYLKGLKLSPSENVEGNLAEIEKSLTILSKKETLLRENQLNFLHGGKKKLHSKEAFVSTLLSESTSVENHLRFVKEFDTTEPSKKSLSFPYPSPEFSEKNQQSFFGLNNYYKDRLDFYNSLAQYTTELENLFIEKGISPFVSDFGNVSDLNVVSLNDFDENEIEEEKLHFLQEFFNKNPHIETDLLIDEILDFLEKKQISQEFSGFRLMSGYKYPDMTSQDLRWFYTLNKNGTKTDGDPGLKTSTPFLGAGSLTLKTSSLPASSKNYPFTISSLPTVSIETKNLIFREFEQNKVIYDGPSLLLDSQKALDWKTPNGKPLRSWFHTYLSPLNSLIQHRENFFGNYYSPQFLVDGKVADFSTFKENSLLRPKYSQKDKGWVLSTDSVQNGFAPSNFSIQVPYETSKITPQLSQDMKSNRFQRFLGLAPSEENEETNKVEQFLPIVQVQQPILSSPKTSILAPNKGFESKGWQESSDFYKGYSSNFNFGVKGNPDYSFSTDFPNEQNFLTKKSSGQYFRKSSVFSKTKKRTSNSFFRENWEPLTSNSWLVISQLSFAIFTFNLLKGLADSYGRELLGYFLDLAAFFGFLDKNLKQQIELLLGERDQGYRVVLKSRKNFHDVVGVQKLLPELYEVIWFLRNSARDFALSKNLPGGILLIGPPGTGKTLLVQALAGEAQVPVVVLSGSSLVEPGASGASKLEMAFQEARYHAPCIVFIDEIDTLSANRRGVTQNPMGTDEVLESVLSDDKLKTSSSSQLLQLSPQNAEKQAASDMIYTASKHTKLSVLMQCLIELDGIRGRHGVVVIGATNRPEVLDPALLRPGRFDKIIKVDLPSHEKRVEILKFYGERLGYQKNIPWDYLGDRTVGFTAADLATLMNGSAIKAIIEKTNHTIKTIEHGIDLLTTSESEKYTVFKTSYDKTTKHQTLSVASQKAILRLAYYQAGKVVLSYLLETHPKSVFVSLWPRRPSIRCVQIETNLQNSVFEGAPLYEILDRLVGCYAGKAAEYLFVEQFRSFRPKNYIFGTLSNLGLDDLQFAQKLIYCLLENWTFYSKKGHFLKLISLPQNINLREYRKAPEKIEFYDEIIETAEIIQKPLLQKIEENTSTLRKKKEYIVVKTNAQKNSGVAWWQDQVSQELKYREKNFANGSRHYLYNPELNERNPEWRPPDEFFHRSSSLKNLKRAYANILRRKRKKQPGWTPKSKYHVEPNQEMPTRKVFLPWNDAPKLIRDYPTQSLALQSYNKALFLLNQNREIFDRIVLELLYKEILRKPEIEMLLKDFQLRKNRTIKDVMSDVNDFEKQKQVKILEFSWGQDSRKPCPRWIDFAQLRGETREETTGETT